MTRQGRTIIPRHEGRFYRTLDDDILRVHRRRVLGVWRPVEENAAALQTARSAA